MGQAFQVLRAHWLLAWVGLQFFPLTSVADSGSFVPRLNADLEGLVSQGTSLNLQLSSMVLALDSSCTELQDAVQSVETYTQAVSAISDNLSAPLSLDEENILALDALSTLTAGIAATLPVLSTDLSNLASSSDLTDIQGAIRTMLALSEDIGVMADRILEMADKILLMADNIGIMADRILLTQQIQSVNIAATQSFILGTQANMLSLRVSFDTSAYDVLLSSLIRTGSQLSVDMDDAPLNASTLPFELAELEARLQAYQIDLLGLVTTVNTNVAGASSFINGDTLALLGDLSTVNAALSASLTRYAEVITTLAPDLGGEVLNDALYSMLRLTTVIGVMGGRVIEMGDKIFLMADNIGVMAGRINETQILQQSNLELTQTNLATAQNNTVALFAAFGL